MRWYNEGMETKGRGCLLVAIVLTIVLLLPLTYVLSIGPAHWLCANGYLSEAAFNAYARPADSVLSRYKPLDDAFQWYLSQCA